jgi:predicted acylesterase/phospholipase RssA
MDISDTIQEPDVDPSCNSLPHIEHLVIPGGGISGLVCYGALRESHRQGVWRMEDIKTIYGTSAGSILAVFIALKYDWEIIDNYLIRRPWQNICDFNMYSIIGSIQKRGIFDIELIRGMFQPLFGGMDMPITITMLEFYEKTEIELHLYTTQFRELKTVDISHKTHPDWSVVEAVYASAALPIFLTPHEKDGEYYIDGGVFLNYPLGPCLSQENVDQKQVLGIRKSLQIDKEISSESTVFDYILLLLNKIFYWILSKNETMVIDQEIAIDTPPVSIYDLYNMISNQNVREEWIQYGVSRAEEFCKTRNLLQDSVDKLS